MTQLPSDHHIAAQARKRANRATWVALPALVAVGAIAWTALEAIHPPASPRLAQSSAQSHDIDELLPVARPSPSPQRETLARPAAPAGSVEATVAEPLERVIELAQINQPLPEPAVPAFPDPEPTLVAAPVDVAPEVVPAEPPKPASCVTQLRRFAQDQIIQFSIGRADLDDSDLPILRRIGQMAENCPGTLIQVKGHTDSIGSDVVNLALSWERADNTIATLAALGIETENFEPIGFGARSPLAQGDSSDEELNRRVEFQVFTTEETSQ